jgi:2,3-bisphosphoglycerate-independent phosphoglycerate mutase
MSDGLPAGPRELPVPAVCLVVLDGWGLAPAGPGNAVSLACTPVFDELWGNYPHTQLTACGRAVGLPEGQMGNSEVGHLNLGAGAVVRQDLTRIDDAVADGSLVQNEALRAAFTGARRVHLLGLVSDGGVHSGWAHLRALIAMAGQMGVADLVVHAFTDGRDTLPHAGAGYLERVEEWLAETRPGRARTGRLGTVVGRYFAMDRDSRWDRVQQAYDALVHGRAARHAASGLEAVRAAYERGETDEFIAATTVGEEARIGPEDSVVAFNFRPDRMRQLTRALADPDCTDVDRGGAAVVTRYTCMTEYHEGWPYPVAFPPERPQVTLSGVLAAQGMRQLHVAETEKYPHVTYFFNGGEESAYAGERRELVASPRDVPTYDHKPQMSAVEAARAFVGAWREDGADGFRFGIINFANADMVGHTGVIGAAVSAIETVDACLGEVVAAVHAGGGACIVTADHGNADHMLEPDGSPNTAHSLNPVPLIVTVAGVALREQGGILADVAPTVLECLGIERPAQMTGASLLAAPRGGAQLRGTGGRPHAAEPGPSGFDA